MKFITVSGSRRTGVQESNVEEDVFCRSVYHDTIASSYYPAGVITKNVADRILCDLGNEKQLLGWSDLDHNPDSTRKESLQIQGKIDAENL
ncbi:unnamed protein product [Ceratitis capitata]|uniref:(Mediterranean fruit fly) hypothetical protein n=1 Tax=Ceratitis capitata TaxID=7213 RepID=A0A811TXQ8_CERCA|nr:unnamed protein product [Ceratitis capitata]